MSVGELRSSVRQLARGAEDEAVNWLLTFDTTVEDLKSELYQMVLAYASSAAVLAADWYNGLNAQSSYSADLDDDLAGPKLFSVAEWVFMGPQSPESRLRVAANRLVFDAARRTIQTNALTEGVALAREEEPRCCTKCIARATTIEKHREGRSDDVEQEFHPSCEGLFVPVRTGVYEPPEYARGWHSRLESARRAGNTNPDDIALWLQAH